MICSISVVLPLPDHPANPKMRIDSALPPFLRSPDAAL